MNWKIGVTMAAIAIVLVTVMFPLGTIYTSRNDAITAKAQQPIELWNYTCGNDINDIAVSEDGNYVAVASQDGNLYFFKQDGTLLWTKNFGSTPPTTVAITEYGTYIFVGAGTTVYLYNNAGTALGSFDTTGDVYYVDITPDGKYAVSFGAYVDFFNLSSGSMPSLYQWYASPPYEVEYGKVSDDGNYVFISPGDGYWYYSGEGVSLYKGKGYAPLSPATSPNAALWTFKDPANGDIYDADMSDDGSYVIVGTYNDHVYLLNNDGTTKWSYTGNDHVYSVSISYDNQYIAAVIGNWYYLFKTSSNTPLWKDSLGLWDSHVAFVRDADTLIVTGNVYWDNTDYYIWAKDTSNNTLWASTYDYTWAFFSSQSYSRFGRAISGDGQYFAGGDSNFKVHFIGPSSVPELNVSATILLFAVVAMGVVVLRKRH